MKEILDILKSMPIEERMEVLNTLREYLKQLEDENPINRVIVTGKHV